MGLSGRDTVAIFGQGPVGLSATLIAKAQGARVIALDIDESRLAKAKAFGADFVVDAGELDVPSAIRDVTGGKGATMVLETSGAAPAGRDALRSAAPWGTICLVGLGSDLTVSLAAVLRTQIRILTSWTMSIQAQRACADFIIERGIDLDALFTERWRLEQADGGVPGLQPAERRKGSLPHVMPHAMPPQQFAVRPRSAEAATRNIGGVMDQHISLEPPCEAAEAFVSRKPHTLFISGKSVPATSGKTFATMNPSTGAILAQLAEGDEEDVDRAIRAARAAFEGPWRRWSPYQRQTLLHRAHDIVERNFEELAQIETMDMGAPISRSRATKAAILRMILFFASQCGNVAGETLPNGLPGNVTTMTFKAPVGVVGGIIPWNGPLGGQWWILGAVLATGCTAVLKPAEDASLSVLRVAELLQEVGLPEGVVNVVTGFGTTAGAALARHPGVDRIAFTGSTATGRKIIEASTINIKKLQLELGGKSPDIVFADADLDKAVPGAAMGVFANSGQICFAGTRVFVQRPIMEEFSRRLADFTSTLRVGQGFDPQTQLGPLISEGQLDRVMSYVHIGSKEGARLVCGGERLGGVARLRLLRVADGVLRRGQPDADCPGGDFRPRVLRNPV